MFDLYFRLVLRPYWSRILIIAASIFLASSLDILSIGMIVPVVGVLIAPEQNSSLFITDLVQNYGFIVGIDTNEYSVVFVGLLVLVVLVTLKNVVLLLQNLLIFRLATKVEMAFSIRMLDYYMRARYDEITRRGRGVILEDRTRAAEGIIGSITVVANLLNSVVMILMSTALLFFMAWWSVPAVAIPMVLVYLYVGPSLQRRAREIGINLHDLRQRFSTATVDFLEGIRVIKTSAKEAMASARIEALFKEHFPIFVASRFIPLIPGSIFETMGAVLVALFVVIIVTRPHLGLSLPELAAMVVLMRRLLPTVSGINQSLIQLSYRARMVEVADETLNKMPLEKMGGIKLLSTQSISSIELEKVTFSYESRKETRVLDEVSLQLKRGRVTALVGQTGSGKSTIADLIMCLYQQDKGQILVDNINLSEIDLLTWRRRIGYVSQDPYLFHTTLHNNITLWDDSVDKNQLDLAIRIAQLDTFLKELPEGYETIVGDRGLTLSGGQRQRVAIARAVLHNPDVLVFDEATSALDNLTEKEVHVAIDKLRADAVLLVIAHRLSTVRDADNVIVLDKGRIVEQGTPADLLKSKGQFWDLYHKDDER